MFINANSLKVKKSGSNTWTNLGDYITEARYGYNKIWGKDTGRNLSGKMSGTLIGIFPKIIVSFKKLTKTQLEDLADILDSAGQQVQYYDAKSKTTKTMNTYTGDWEVVNKHIIDSSRKNEPFEISFISTTKRS